MIKELRGMNAYAYSVLADRAYGKIVEKQQIAVAGISLETILKARKLAGLPPRAVSDEAPVPDDPSADV
jgi:hypothetical protein